MAEYIEREVLKQQLKLEGDCGHVSTLADVLDIVDFVSTTDVAPVRHAKWDENGRCTNCGGHAPFLGMASTYYKSPWCHECGCKMDLQEA